MSHLDDVARELSRVRTLAQTTEYPRDKASSYAECLFLDGYGRLPSILDLQRSGKKRVTLVPHDDEGRTIRIVTRDLLPMRVYKRFLDTDIYVYAKTGRIPEMTRILGWLPRLLVVELPIFQFEKTAARPYTDYCHDVDPEFMIKMPNKFVFEEVEHHNTGAWNGIWDNISMGWNCCSCDRLIPDAITRRRAEKERDDEDH